MGDGVMSETGVLPDLPARHRALLDHSTTLLVQAGAGSGKPALMAGRVALLLAAGIPTREIVAITFTEAAASELRERIEGFVNRLARADRCQLAGGRLLHGPVWRLGHHAVPRRRKRLLGVGTGKRRHGRW